jgi:hypothetical protein
MRAPGNLLAAAVAGSTNAPAPYGAKNNPDRQGV